MPSTLVAVYWKARPDTLEACSANLQRHFDALATTSDALSHWYLKANRKPKEPKEVDVGSFEILSALLSKGVNRRDIDKSVITELGWSASLWNGDRGEFSASTSVHCNCTTPRVSNSALLNLKSDDAQPLDDESGVRLLKRFIDIWRPDEGRITRSVWDADASERRSTDIVSYAKSNWPVVLTMGAERYGGGLLRRLA
jgi:hypothetical protein